MVDDQMTNEDRDRRIAALEKQVIVLENELRERVDRVKQVLDQFEPLTRAGTLQKTAGGHRKG
jgi:hypothetical protein